MRRALAVLLLVGCGTLGAEGGGDTDLPNRGVVPYTVATLDGVGELTEPAAVVVGAEVHLFATEEAPGGSSVVRLRSQDGLRFGAPEIIEGGARSPSAVVHEGVVQLAFVRGGRVFMGPVGEPEATSIEGDAPSLVSVDGELQLYVSRAEQVLKVVDGRAGPTILLPGRDCVDPAGEPEACWDAGLVGSAEIRVGTSATGRRLWRLMYGGGRGDARSIGFAASWDGVVFTRYAFNPIVPIDAMYDGDPKDAAPSNVRLGDRYLLYFERDGVLAAAVNDAGAAAADQL